MQIQKIHDDQHPYSPPTGPHAPPTSGIPTEQEIAQTPKKTADVPLSGVADTDIAELIEKLRELPELDAEVIQLAQARFESGQLISREAAELVASSPLKEFVF